MTLHEPLSEITWITPATPGAIQIGQRTAVMLGPTRGWYWVAPHGLCIGVLLDKPSPQRSWLQRVTLLLMATDFAIDCGLLLEQGQLWLIRRYDADIDSVELEAALQQQLAVSRFLTVADEVSAKSPKSRFESRPK